MSAKLTVKDIVDLDRLEKIVQLGQKTFVAVGRAMVEINQRQLWRRDYSTEEAYWEKRWGWGRSHMHRQLAAFKVDAQLQEEGVAEEDLPQTEREARAIAAVPAKDRAAVVSRVRRKRKKLSDKSVAEAVSEGQEQYDSLGRLIPEEITGYWNRSKEVQSILTKLSTIRGDLTKAQEDGDLMYAEVNFATALDSLGKAWTSIQCAKPYAVCPTCQGRPSTQTGGKCRLCFGRGLVSKFRWDRLVPEEMKAVVLKGICS